MNSMNDDDKEFSPIRPKSVHEQCHLLIDEILTEFEKVEQENERLRAKVRSQRAELRRLNDAMLRKNARVENAEVAVKIAEQIVQTMEHVSGIRVVSITPGPMARAGYPYPCNDDVYPVNIAKDVPLIEDINFAGKKID